MLCTEHALLKAANNEDLVPEVHKLQGKLSTLTVLSIEKSCFGKDLSVSELSRQLPLLYDIIKKSTPSVKAVTSVNTISEAMNSQEVFKQLLPSIHKFLCLYLTVPITSATSERLFSALKRLYTRTFGHQ